MPQIVLYRSQLISQKHKIPATLIAMGVIAIFLPKCLGNSYQYQTMLGLASFIILICYTIPSILIPESLKKSNILLGNFLIACLPFLAINFIISSILFIITSFRKEHLKLTIGGILLALLFNYTYFINAASWRGYLADHIYMNVKIMPYFSHAPHGLINMLSEFTTRTLLYPTSTILAFFIGLATLLSFYLLIKDHIRDKKYIIKILLLLMTIYSLGIRSYAGFHAIPFYYALIALFTILFAPVVLAKNTIINKYKVLIVAILVVGLSFRIYILSSHKKLIPNSSEFSQLVKKITNPEDKIIVYTFKTSEYLLSQRLPASGSYFLFPWQVEYNKNPQYGIMIDHCSEIKMNLPKIMFLDKEKVWDEFEWNSYGTCIDDIAKESYIAIYDKPYYIRKDIFKSPKVQEILKEKNLIN